MARLPTTITLTLDPEVTALLDEATALLESLDAKLDALTRKLDALDPQCFPPDGAAASRATRPGNTAKAPQAPSSGQEPELQLDSPSTSRPASTEPEA